MEPQKLFLKIAFLILFVSIASVSFSTNPPSLKKVYANYFPIGVALSPSELYKVNETELIKYQYNSITATNQMKPEMILRKDGSYDFALADTLVRFAKNNRMKVRGHTLVWHNQTPDFFFRNEKGEKLDSTALYKKLEQYMKTVINHFGDDVYVWDVVNEALSDSPAEFYRTKSPWYEACGSGFIEKAFRMAHAINPKAKLFYNDYNLIQPVKRDKAYRMLKELLAKGVPINGVGMQGHWAISDVTREKIQQSIDLFSSLGIEIQITELDLTVYGNYHGENVNNQTKETLKFTPEIADKQAASYKMIFEILRANKSKISSVTFWGLSDKHSWLNNFPIKGRKDYPLLFDDNLQPKPAFWSVVKWD